ncbi:MAG: MerR family transcriptional regulator [Candidatus Margulisbacteria bacterium]|nr:MerR family transcriptional regulator [Candidatus Margulisiibacteriota bacterium]MBU1617206.1 MerR family transcriptional regulator [Candidatus Margulisiibacteriota bacterium]
MYRWLHDSDKPVYTIHIAAELVGCHPRTLRIYEEEGLIQPKRTPKNYRLYSQSDLAMVRKISNLIGEMNLTLAGVKALFTVAECFDIEIDKMFQELLD